MKTHEDLIKKYRIWLKEVNDEERELLLRLRHLNSEKRKLLKWICELKGIEGEC
jgi:hypothetical protein